MIEFIARKVVSNVRELEGALNRVIAYASMSGMPINNELASAVLSNVMYNPKKRSITPQRIVRAVADYYGVNLDQLRSSKRDRAIVVPRQIAMFLIREETDISCCASAPSWAAATTRPCCMPATRSRGSWPRTTRCGARSARCGR